jgi:hypothetical protein
MILKIKSGVKTVRVVILRFNLGLDIGKGTF